MKTFWIILGLIVVIGGIYFLTNKSNNGKADYVAQKDKEQSFGTDADTDGDVAASEEFKSTSIADLVKDGSAHICSTSTNINGIKTTGTVYVAGEEVSADFTSVIPQNNVTVKSHMMSDGEFVYSWSDGSKQGIKAKVTATATPGSGASLQSFNFDQKYDFSCSIWARDASQFALPSGVVFVEAK